MTHRRENECNNNKAKCKERRTDDRKVKVPNVMSETMDLKCTPSK
jgi:hypothetical protein